MGRTIHGRDDTKPIKFHVIVTVKLLMLFLGLVSWFALQLACGYCFSTVFSVYVVRHIASLVFAAISFLPTLTLMLQVFDEWPSSETTDRVPGARRDTGDLAGRTYDDRPIIQKDQDCLNVWRTAETLAKFVCNTGTEEGFVILVNGKWGIGKTSFINLLRLHIREMRPDLEMMTFDPWWLSKEHGDGSITRRFFRELSDRANRKGSSFWHAKEALGEWADAVCEMKIGYVSLLKPIVRRIHRKDAELTSIRDSLRSRLRGRRPTLTVIDDIDRLTACEMLEVFQLVKSVADFPNMIYLLSMDKEAVASSLSRELRINGNDYLEKIVQYEFSLPVPEAESIETMYDERIGRLLEPQIQDDPKSRYYFSHVRRMVLRMLKSPRDVTRLANSLHVAVPALSADTEPADLVAIEAIRLKNPGLYSTIRENEAMFVGGTSLTPDSAYVIDFHQKWWSREVGKDRDSCEIVTCIFPRAGSSVKEPSMFPPRWTESDRKRICIPGQFQCYFRLSLPLGSVSQEELERAIELSHDPYDLGRSLVGMDTHATESRSRALDLLRLMVRRKDAMGIENVTNTLKAIFHTADLLADNCAAAHGREPYEFFGDLFVVVRGFLQKISEAPLGETLRSLITEGAAVSFCIFIVESLPDEPTLLNDLGILLTGKLAGINRSDLMGIPLLPDVLAFWARYDLNKAKEFVNETTASGPDLVEFLTRFIAPEPRVKDMKDGIVSGPFVDVRNMDNLLDLKAIADRLKLLVTAEILSKDQRYSFNSFIEEHSKDSA